VTDDHIFQLVSIVFFPIKNFPHRHRYHKFFPNSKTLLIWFLVQFCDEYAFFVVIEALAKTQIEWKDCLLSSLVKALRMVL
jgi:hypothetical protein